MHKGYTLNYFIKYFSSIPDNQWCEGTLQRDDTIQHCALGHCGRRGNKTLSETAESARVCEERQEALNRHLNGFTVAINDGGDGTENLGKTPRGRILRALRNKKRTGSVFGYEE